MSTVPTAPQVAHALQRVFPHARVDDVQVLDHFSAHPSSVMRIRIIGSTSDGQSIPQTMIAKLCQGIAYGEEGLPEIATYEQILPLLAHSPAPTYLGASTSEGTREALLLTEDFTATCTRPTQPVTDALLEALVGAIAPVHAAFWASTRLSDIRFTIARTNPTRMPQAFPASIIRANAAPVGDEIRTFRSRFARQLTDSEHRVLHQLESLWADRFIDRSEHRESITLIHGDLHVLGNIFIRECSGNIRIIDWAACKPGLGPHDLAYCLLGTESDDRVARDARLLDHYLRCLTEHGVSGYSMDQCLWDFRFGMVTNVLQCVLQRSLPWLRRTMVAIEAWDGAQALSSAYPRS